MLRLYIASPDFSGDVEKGDWFANVIREPIPLLFLRFRSLLIN
ncbi:hypothetical protein [Coleofasciculus sp. G2-EDA-02]